MLNVSPRTVYRRVCKLLLEDVTGFSNISDDDLDQHIQHFKQVHDLFLELLRVQQKGVAKALVRVGPTNSGLRWAALIKRKNTMFQIQTVFGILMDMIVWLIGGL